MNEMEPDEDDEDPREYESIGGMILGGVVAVIGILIAMILLATLAEKACADEPAQPPCTWSTSAGVGTLLKSGQDKAAVWRVRAEGSCTAGLGVHVGARVDGLRLPGSTGDAPPPSFSDLSSLNALEEWASAWRPVASVQGVTISSSLLFGAQQAIQAGQLGLGGTRTTFGAGVRLDYAGAWAGLWWANRYAPVPGSHWLIGGALPVKGGVRVTFVGALGKNSMFEPAPMAGN